MSDFRIETEDERRARYVRLARAATEAAAKSPLPVAKQMYVKLAQAWVAMAQKQDPDGVYNETEPQMGDFGPPRDDLNVKLNGLP